jgi:hypothetical protein
MCTEKTDNLDLEENIDDPNTVFVQQNTSETQNQPSTSSLLTSKITHTSIKTSQSQTVMDSFIPRPLSLIINTIDCSLSDFSVAYNKTLGRWR